MYQPEAMRCIDRRAHTAEDQQDRVWQQFRPQFDFLAQRSPDQSFHDEERLPTADDAEVVDRDDVGVHETCRKSCFLEEPLDRTVGAGDVVADDLGRDRAIECHVVCFVHGSHPADRETPVQAVPSGKRARQVAN